MEYKKEVNTHKIRCTKLLCIYANKEYKNNYGKVKKELQPPLLLSCLCGIQVNMGTAVKYVV